MRYSRVSKEESNFFFFQMFLEETINDAAGCKMVVRKKNHMQWDFEEKKLHCPTFPLLLCIQTRSALEQLLLLSSSIDTQP